MLIGEYISFLAIQLLNPGIATLAKNPDDIEENPGENIENRQEYCNKCKTSDGQHCYQCDLCFKDLDHHCGVIGRCVAKNNLKYFYIFMVWTVVSIGYLYFIFAYTAY